MEGFFSFDFGEEKGPLNDLFDALREALLDPDAAMDVIWHNHKALDPNGAVCALYEYCINLKRAVEN